MDEIDRDILLHLQENARSSFTELGKKVGLSTPAVNERVKKLEEKGSSLAIKQSLIRTK